MEAVRSSASKAKQYLKTHRLARIAVAVLAVVLVLILLLHPRGTKTFLIIGADNYGSLNTENVRSDVIMLAQVDFTHADVSVVTFARDLFIENENGWLTKINTILKSKGEDELLHLIEKNFGVDIDGWFLVNFTSVIELVDAIGGAEIELTREEVLYLNKNAGIYPDNPLSEGVCRLNGGQALAYARCRKLDSDFARGARQGKLMQAMVAQTKKMTIGNIVSVFNSLKHAWHSSYTGAEQAGLLSQAIWLRGADVERIVMPMDSWRYGNAPSGVNGVLADLEENRALLREVLGYPAEAAAAE